MNVLQGQRVVIVGPSPSLVGSKKGADIDTYDIVIRLKKGYPVPNNHREDYGSRTDILMTNLRIDNGTNSLEPATLRRFVKQGGRFLCVPYPVGNGRDRHELSKTDKLMVSNWEGFHPGEIPVVYPIRYSEWSQLQKALGSKPSIGLLSIWLILKQSVKELFVTGFTFRQEYLSGHQENLYLNSYKDQPQLTHSLWTLRIGIHSIPRELRYLRK